MISSQYIALLNAILISGNTQNITYSNQDPEIFTYEPSQNSFSFQLPTSIVIIAKNNGSQVASAQAQIIDVVEQDNELSVTFSALFSTEFSADELDLYAQYGNTLAYKIAHANVNVSSSPSSQLNVLWTIEYTVNNVFDISINVSNTVSIPYIVHLLLAYTIIPNLPHFIQTNYPNIPLAQMVSQVPAPSGAGQFNGITKCYIVDQNGNIIAQSNVSNGQSVITPSQSAQNVYIIGVYTLANTNISLMQSIYTISVTSGQSYSITFGVNISSG